ncbi:response regulator transcription factor [Pontiellaceae bacterium B12227]|nr:response regulator transcription factor [Pontiellaceae bacterium B12227]
MSATPSRIMVVEDNAIFRHAIASALNKTKKYESVAEASSGDEAFRLLEDETIQPDIILLDLEMPGTHGLDAIPRLLQLAPQCRIIILTQSDREGHVLQAITRGASGYLLKTATRKEIFNSIQEVWEGGASIDPKLAHIALQLIRRIQPEAPEEDDNLLTAREVEVLQMLSEGYVKKEIANQLGLSLHAIDKRMRRIYNKLQVQNVAAAVATALRKGWI